MEAFSACGGILKIICFDLGSTLEDETNAHLARSMEMAKLLTQRGYVISPDEIFIAQKRMARDGMNGSISCSLGYLGVSNDDIAICREKVKWNSNLCTINEGVGQLLERLRTANYRIVLIANQSKPVEDRLRKYGILDYFDMEIISCEVGVEKPDKAIFELVYKRFESNNEFWMIGDRVDNDIVPAKELGWKTIRIKSGIHQEYLEKCDLEKADYQVSEIGRLGKMLELFN